MVISDVGIEEEVCHRTQLDLHLSDAEVVVSPALSWKRLGNCRTVSVVNDGHIVRVRARFLVWDSFNELFCLNKTM